MSEMGKTPWFRSRAILEQDLDECAQIYIEAYSQEPWLKEWGFVDAKNRLGTAFHKKETLGLVMEKEDGRIAGFVLGSLEQYLVAKNYFLQELCVHPEQQKQGLGGRLVHDLMDMLRSIDVTYIYLLTRSDTGLEQFYGKHGFQDQNFLRVMGREL